jgi:hypothetical protein
MCARSLLHDDQEEGERTKSPEASCMSRRRLHHGERYPSGCAPVSARAPSLNENEETVNKKIGYNVRQGQTTICLSRPARPR